MLKDERDNKAKNFGRERTSIGKFARETFPPKEVDKCEMLVLFIVPFDEYICGLVRALPAAVTIRNRSMVMVKNIGFSWSCM